MKVKNVVIFVIILSLGIAFYFIYNHYFYTGELVRIKRTEVYHRTNCSFVKKCNIKDIEFLSDLLSTKNLRPCKECKPPDNKNIVWEEDNTGITIYDYRSNYNGPIPSWELEK